MVGLAWGMLEIAEGKEQPVFGGGQRTVGGDAEAALLARLTGHRPLLHMLLKCLRERRYERSELFAGQAGQVKQLGLTPCNILIA